MAENDAVVRIGTLGSREVYTAPDVPDDRFYGTHPGRDEQAVEIIQLKAQLAEARTYIAVLTGELRDARRAECDRFMTGLRLTLESFYRDMSR